MRTTALPSGCYIEDNAPPAKKQRWQIQGQDSSEAQTKEEVNEGSRGHIGGARAHCGNDFKVGAPVQKEFDGQMFSGTITFAPVDVGTEFYRVVYEDGDGEEVDHHELKLMVPEGADGGGGGGGGGVSDYELLRLENIQRNEQFLRSLGRPRPASPEHTARLRGTRRAPSSS